MAQVSPVEALKFLLDKKSFSTFTRFSKDVLKLYHQAKDQHNSEQKSPDEILHLLLEEGLAERIKISNRNYIKISNKKYQYKPSGEINKLLQNKILSLYISMGKNLNNKSKNKEKQTINNKEVETKNTTPIPKKKMLMPKLLFKNF